MKQLLPQDLPLQESNKEHLAVKLLDTIQEVKLAEKTLDSSYIWKTSPNKKKLSTSWKLHQYREGDLSCMTIHYPFLPTMVALVVAGKALPAVSLYSFYTDRTPTSQSKANISLINDRTAPTEI
jgi:hypothetical protein